MSSGASSGASAGDCAAAIRRLKPFVQSVGEDRISAVRAGGPCWPTRRVASILPAVTGYAIGGWWAILPAIWTLAAGGLPEDLEPLKPSRSGDAELGGTEGTVVFMGLLLSAAHLGLIAAGCVARKVKRWP